MRMWWIHGQRKLSYIYGQMRRMVKEMEQAILECSLEVEQMEKEMGQLRELMASTKGAQAVGERVLGKLKELV